jgi:hypothetical protein
LRRACSIEEDYKAAGGEVLLDNDGEDGWLATHGFDRGIQKLSNQSWRCKNSLIPMVLFWDDYGENHSRG